MPMDGAGRAWPAPAKLNLFLHLVGRRDDGYHLLQTVFQLLDWGDTVYLRPRTDGVIRRTMDLDGIPECDDLTVRAARLLRDHADRPHAGVEIAVDFVARLRGQITFTGIEGLITQMDADVARTREVLARATKG